MSEFSLINKYCKNIGVHHPETKLSVGDDAALVKVPEGYELAISVDTMVEGRHFLATETAENLAHKILAVNLSDMAAMGAKPKWATLSLSIVEYDEQWLSAFSDALDTMAKEYQLQLIGGDTTKGPLCLSLQIMGLVKPDCALTRHGVLAGDDIYVSENVGDAALALALLQGRIKKQNESSVLTQSLTNPIPRVELGQALSSIANSCIDVSDGLLAELTHLCQNSTAYLQAKGQLTEQQCLTAQLNVDKLPLSDAYQAYFQQTGYTLALSGGDDYELCFTATQSQRESILALSVQLGLKLTRIGSIKVSSVCDELVRVFDHHGSVNITSKGYNHF